MRKRFIWFLGAVLVIIILSAVVLIINQVWPRPAARSTADTEYMVHRMTSDGAPLLGNPEAPLTLVVFLDFSCTHCAGYRDTINAFIDRYVRPGDMRLEMRLLSGLDPAGSALAARAALCAAEQDGFWAMFDTLLALQTDYGRTAFSLDRIRATGQSLQLDVNELSLCVSKATSFQEALQNNIDLAVNLDVRSLPAVLFRRGSNMPERFTRDGQPITGAIPLRELSAALDGMLE